MVVLWRHAIFLMRISRIQRSRVPSKSYYVCRCVFLSSLVESKLHTFNHATQIISKYICTHTSGLNTFHGGNRHIVHKSWRHLLLQNNANDTRTRTCCSPHCFNRKDDMKRTLQISIIAHESIQLYNVHLECTWARTERYYFVALSKWLICYADEKKNVQIDLDGISVSGRAICSWQLAIEINCAIFLVPFQLFEDSCGLACDANLTWHHIGSNKFLIFEKIHKYSICSVVNPLIFDVCACVCSQPRC